METVIDEKSLFIHNENENVQSKTIQSLTSDKRDVIDSWINNRDNDTT
ncbi:unnamed protein product, partial [Rotaria magnacalcarata]